MYIFAIVGVGPESLEPLSEWAWCCFAGIVFGVHNHYILQLAGLVTINTYIVLFLSSRLPILDLRKIDTRAGV